MNCEELNRSIKDLETELEQVSETIEEFSEGAEGINKEAKRQLSEIEEKLSGVELKRDGVLMDYIEQFFATCPELRQKFDRENRSFLYGLEEEVRPLIEESLKRSFISESIDEYIRQRNIRQMIEEISESIDEFDTSAVDIDQNMEIGREYGFSTLLNKILLD